MALGGNLRADEDVGLAGVNALDQCLPLLARVFAESRSARRMRACGKRAGEELLQPLRSPPEGWMSIAAGRAGLPGCASPAAMMATQASISFRWSTTRLRHSGGSSRSSRRTAGQHRRVAATVEEDEALFAAHEPLSDRRQNAGALSLLCADRCAVGGSRDLRGASFSVSNGVARPGISFSVEASSEGSP